MIPSAVSQHICAASTLFCYARAVPLWIIALIGLALIPLRARVASRLRRKS